MRGFRSGGGILSTILPSFSCLWRVFLQVPRSEESRQPCFMPLHISKGSDELPLNCTVPFMLERKDSIKLCSFRAT